MRLVSNIKGIRTGLLLVNMLMFLSLVSSAQQIQTQYFLNVPQSGQMNPAIKPLCRGYVGLPGFHSTYLGLSNNSFKLEDVLFYGEGEYSDSLITPLHPSYDLDDFLGKLKNVNRLASEVTEAIFSMGFTSGDSYIFMDLADRVSASVIIPGDFATLALKGNEDFLNSAVDLSDLQASVTYFRELGIGFSKEFSRGLRIGIRARALFGIGNLYFENRGTTLSIDPSDLYSHTLDADISLNVSQTMGIERDPETGLIDSISTEGIEHRFEDPVPLLTNFGNPGFGLDLGAIWDVNRKLSLHASVIDFGFIRWKDEATNLEVKGSYKFEGLDISNLLNVNDSSDIEASLDQLLDTVLSTFDPAESYDPYTSYIPAKVILGVNYELHENISVGLLSKTLIEKGRLWESLTLSANLRAGKALTTSFSYSMTNGSYNNLGFGLSLRGGPLQFYAVTDKVFFKRVNIITDSKTIPIPRGLDSFSLRFGLNIIFGCQAKNPNDRPLIY